MHYRGICPKVRVPQTVGSRAPNVLFPIRDGEIFRGTFRDTDIMYDGMIEAFNKAIASLGKEDQEEHCEAHSLL